MAALGRSRPAAKPCQARSQATWFGRNVLSIGDVTWGQGFFDTTSLDGEQLLDALRAEVKVNRVKKNYFEKDYSYEYVVTPDHADVARRAATWMFVYLWRRGVFAIQYHGMAAAAVAATVTARAAGVVGGMPPGAVLDPAAAIKRWLGGERAYLRVSLDDGQVVDLAKEPFFVQLTNKMAFLTLEMQAKDVGNVYRALGGDLGVRPHASGVNSGRRNAAVAMRWPRCGLR